MKTFIVPTGINLITYVNETLVSARRRGFDGTLELPTLRERAKGAVYESVLLTIETSVAPKPVGEFK